MRENASEIRASGLFGKGRKTSIHLTQSRGFLQIPRGRPRASLNIKHDFLLFRSLMLAGGVFELRVRVNFDFSGTLLLVGCATSVTCFAHSFGGAPSNTAE